MIHAAVPTKQTLSSSNKNLYKVQIGAFRNRNNANNLLNKAKQAGFNAFISVEDDLYKSKSKRTALRIMRLHNLIKQKDLLLLLLNKSPCPSKMDRGFLFDI